MSDNFQTDVSKPAIPLLPASNGSDDCCPACGQRGTIVMGDYPHLQCNNRKCRVHRFRDIPYPNDSAHRWRPLRDARTIRLRGGAAIRCSAWLGLRFQIHPPASTSQPDEKSTSDEPINDQRRRVFDAGKWSRANVCRPPPVEQWPANALIKP